jgi:hypothetical protein
MAREWDADDQLSFLDLLEPEDGLDFSALDGVASPHAR